MPKRFIVSSQGNASADAYDKVFATISGAVEKARAGDVITIVPGIYREAVVLGKKGVTLQSSNLAGVVIAPPPGLSLPADKWQRASGCQEVYEQALPEEYLAAFCKTQKGGRQIYRVGALNLFVDDYCYEFVQVCGKGLHFNFGNGERTYTDITIDMLDDSYARRWTITPKGMVQVHMEGVDPSKTIICLKDAQFCGITFTAVECLVKGITIEGGRMGFRFRASRNTVEDCVVRDAYYGARIQGDRDAVNCIVRRCAFLKCKEGVFISDNMGVHIIEENMFIGTGQPLLTQRSPQNCINEPWGPGTAARYADTHYIVFRHNVLADNTWAGWWPDVNCYGNYFYGNIITNIRDRGIYNEYPVNDTRIYYNAITDCDDGIIQRFSWRTMNLYNYLAGNRNSGISIWGPHVDNGYVYDNVFMRNIVIDNGISFMYNDNEGMGGNLPVAWPGDGNITSTALARIRSQFVNENLYGLPGKRGFASINGTRFETPESLGAVTGYNKACGVSSNPALEAYGLGMYTVNIPFSQHPQKPVPVVGNPVRDMLHTDLLPIAAEDAPYFWQQGTWEEQRGGDFWKSAYGYAYEWPHTNRPVRRLMRTRPGFDPESARDTYASGDAELAQGPGLYMELVSHIPGEIPAMGSGFWSPSLPAVEGLPICVSFHAASEGLLPLGGRGFAMVIKFTSLQGKTIATEALFDREYKGNNPWEKYDKTVIVPKGANRFAIFIAMLPCEKDSIVRVGNIYIHSNKEKYIPRFEMPQFKKATLVDLHAFYNHDLNQDSGGPEGAYPIDGFVRSYCGMGTVDLSGLEKGDFTFKGIPVYVERAVTLQCHRRPPATLARNVRGISIGKSAKALAFFHAGGYMAMAQETFRYVVHYADGSRTEVVPVEEKSMMTYRQPFFVKDASCLLPAVACGHWQKLACLVWVNPHPEKEIHSVDFMTMDTGNAILISMAALDAF